MSANGCLTHLGRSDAQVKVREYSIDLAEIEHVLLHQEAVKASVVITQEDPVGNTRLVAYLVPAVKPAPTGSALRDRLKRTLAEPMIPSTFVMLDALPVLPSGKIDHRALPLPDRVRPDLDALYVAPRTPIEEALTHIWTEVLGLDRVGIHDPFLELGGHSLLATRLLSRVIETLQVNLPLRTLLETPTIAEMAVVITQHRAVQVDPETIACLLAEVEALAEDNAPPPPIDTES
jgi:surfactin family lipopeptide synthetase A